MKHSNVSEQQISEEVKAMLKVCFEGDVSSEKGVILLTLPNGQMFSVTLREL